MLLITGANGKLGRLIVDDVLRRAPDAPFAVSVRDASAAADLAERGVDVRQADYHDLDSIRAAFTGVHRLLLMPTPSPDPDARVAEMIPVARARSDRGDRRAGHTPAREHLRRSHRRRGRRRRRHGQTGRARRRRARRAGAPPRHRARNRRRAHPGRPRRQDLRPHRPGRRELEPARRARIRARRQARRLPLDRRNRSRGTHAGGRNPGGPTSRPRSGSTLPTAPAGLARLPATSSSSRADPRRPPWTRSRRSWTGTAR
jgi:NAD(P)H-binding